MKTLDWYVRAAAANRPEAEAVVDAPNRSSFFSGEPQRLTWSQLDAAINSVASALIAAGVVRGEPVAIQLPNAVELPVTILACARIGAVATPFPVQHRQHELRYGLGASKAKWFVTGDRPDRDDVVTSTAEVCAEFDATVFTFGSLDGTVGTVDGTIPLVLDGGQGDISSDDISPEDLSPEDIATICWTSGTTGVPKGVPRTHAMWLATSGFQVAELSLGVDDRILCPFPLVNMGGIGGMLVPWVETGSTLVLHHPIDLPVFLGQITNERITYTVAPPPLLNMLLRNDSLLEGVDMSTIRAITSGSAPLDPWMVEGWEAKGIEIVNAFGSNEGASLLSTRASVPDPTERARYFPVPDRDGVEIRLVDNATGNEITEVGVPGELRFRGVTVFPGYLESDGAEFDSEGYYRTGDIFERATSASGAPLFRFIDRAKDIIIRGGMNISAAEVEALVSSHPSVGECAVVAAPGGDLGERVAVFVVTTADTTPPTLDDVVDHLRGLDVASYKLPERIEHIDVLPRNPVGKVTKETLRTQLREPSAS